jgi:hypothetical protein
MRHGLALLSLVLPLLAQQPPKTGLTLAGLSLPGASILTDTDSRAYYLYSTSESPGSGVVAYKSQDLAKWEGPFPVFKPPDGSWANTSEGLRNPEVHHYRGRYYLLVTLAASGQVIAKPPESWRVNTRQGTQIFVSDSPLGPFTAIPGSVDKSHTPENFVAQDGTLYVEGDLAYLVYVHDWTQVVDATIEAVRLKADLSVSVEDALHLFKASDAPWLQQQTAASREPRYYEAGEPFLYRTRSGSLVMIWSSAFGGKSAITVARSVTGKVRGPWKQADTLLRDGSLPGTIFSAFDGRLMMAVHQPQARVRLVELTDAGDTLRLKPAAK